MGSFITNVHVRTSAPQKLLERLPELGALPAYVSDAHDGWVGIYPEVTETQDERVIVTLCAKLSLAPFSKDVVALLVHDSDVFCYWHYLNGAALDAYNSLPGYFDGEKGAPSGGGERSLASLAPHQSAELTQLLHERAVFNGQWVDAVELAAEFGALVGIGPARATFCFGYARDGELPPGVSLLPG